MSLEVNQTDYRNDRHSYRWHCNAYEVIFYDKIRDLSKQKNAASARLRKTMRCNWICLKFLKRESDSSRFCSIILIQFYRIAQWRICEAVTQMNSCSNISLNIQFECNAKRSIWSEWSNLSKELRTKVAHVLGKKLEIKLT